MTLDHDIFNKIKKTDKKSKICQLNFEKFFIYKVYFIAKHLHVIKDTKNNLIYYE